MTPSDEMDLKEFLNFVGDYCRQHEVAWQVITCLRGPDSPSERPDMSPSEHDAAYRARRERKKKTVEVIRGAAVGQVGGARTRQGDSVILPPQSQWDHFDRHVSAAANALGLKVVIEPEKAKVPVTVTVREGASANITAQNLKMLQVASANMAAQNLKMMQVAPPWELAKKQAKEVK